MASGAAQALETLSRNHTRRRRRSGVAPDSIFIPLLHRTRASKVREARPPRAWLDAPSRPASSARDGFHASAQSSAPGIFREGAENSARGGRAPTSIPEFGANRRDAKNAERSRKDGFSAFFASLRFTRLRHLVAAAPLHFGCSSATLLPCGSTPSFDPHCSPKPAAPHTSAFPLGAGKTITGACCRS